MAYIYEIRNKKNNKIYIGSTNNISKRWNSHSKTLQCNKHHNKHLQNAWIKYGKSCFKFSIIEEIDAENQFEKEQEYINAAIANGTRLYNICLDVNNPSSQETIVKKCEHERRGNVCGIEFETSHYRQKYCAKCSEERSQQYIKKFIEPKRKEFRIIADSYLPARVAQMEICAYLGTENGEDCNDFYNDNCMYYDNDEYEEED